MAASGRGSLPDPLREPLREPTRWGLNPEAIADLGQRLCRFCAGYRGAFLTDTRDSSAYAAPYLSAQLRLEGERNFTTVGRAVSMSPQNIQHFISNSPWDARLVFWQVQREIARTPALEQGGVLILDESADQKTSVKTAGSGRQYNGRLGKVEMSQVGTFLAFAHPTTNLWTWVDGELFIPEAWFTPERAQERRRLGIPEDCTFATKLELGWRMIQRAKEHRLPFEAVACDDLYGRKDWLRREMDKAGLVYMADVPCSTQVFLTRPAWGVPEQTPGPGRPFSNPRVLDATSTVTVAQVASLSSTAWQTVSVRPTERGHLADDFACVRVLTLRDDHPTEEWLVMRRHTDGTCSYALCNAPSDTALERLAWLKCVRHFIERANQDAKSEAGWDGLRSQKYRAWEHHLALTVMATWFVAQTKLAWAQRHPPDPLLARQMQTDRLAGLSMANVRTLLRAVLPLPQLTPEEASRLVVEQLYGRTQVRKSRLKNGRKPPT